MIAVLHTGAFRHDVKIIAKRGWQLSKLYDVINHICAGKQFPPSFRLHKLKGEYSGCWECHIEADWLLVWEVRQDHILLIRTGSHADLFE